MRLHRLFIIAIIMLLLIHPVAFADDVSAAKDKSDKGKGGHDKGGHGDDHGSDDDSSHDSDDHDSGDSSSADDSDDGSDDSSSTGESDDTSDDSSSGGYSDDSPETTVDTGSANDSPDDHDSDDSSSADDSVDESDDSDDDSDDDSSSGGDSDDSPETTVDTGSANDSPDEDSPDDSSGDSPDDGSNADSEEEPEAPPTTEPPATGTEGGGEGVPQTTTPPPTTVPPTTAPPQTTVPPTTPPPTTAPITTSGGGGGAVSEVECDIPEPTEDITVALGDYPSGGITQADERIETDDAKSANFDIRCDKYYVIVEEYDDGGYGVAYIDDDTRLVFSNTDDTGNMPMRKYLETGDKIKLSGTHFKICIDPAGSSMILSKNLLDACSFGGDTTAPTITVTSPENTTYDTTEITLSATADEPVTWTYSLDGGPETAFTPDITITTTEGPHTITITATDTSGNQATESVTFTVDIPDTTPPTITVTSPENTTYDTTEITLSATADEPVTWTYSLDGGPETAFTPDITITTTEGPHTITITATDTSGNQATESVTFTVDIPDTTPPTITCPADTTVEAEGPDGSAVALTATATDDTDPSPTITSDELAVYPLGTTTVTFTATDASGNSASCTTDVTVVDTTPPVVNLISPLESTGDNDGNITFVYTVADKSPIASCSISVNEVVLATDASVERDVPQEFSIGLDYQGYNWAVECADTSGNTGSSGLQALAVVLTYEFIGNTTDLSELNISEVSNFTLDKPEHGKIKFTEVLDLSNGADLNLHVTISHNKIEIDSEAVPALNRTAILYIYNLTFKNPIILRNGEKCPSSICTKISYENGTFVFSVTQFSTYEAWEETTSTPPPAAPPAAGGGGGGDSGESHSLDITELEISNAKAGKTAVLSVTIENTGCCNEKAKLWIPSLPPGWEAEEKDIELSVGTSVIELKLKIPVAEIAGTKEITVEIVPEDFTPSIQKDLLVDISEVPKIFQISTKPMPSPIPPLNVKVENEPALTILETSQECPTLPYIIIILLLITIIFLLLLLLRKRKREEEEKEIPENTPSEVGPT